MRDDFQSVLTGDFCLRYPSAQLRRVAFSDEDVEGGRPLGRARELDKGWRESSSFRYALVPRFLGSRVGCRFDGVMAEVAGAMTDRRLRALAEREVRRHVDLVRGVDRRGRVRLAQPWSGSASFYVDAEGILRAEEPRLTAATRATRAVLRSLCRADRIDLVDPLSASAAHAAVERVDGIWYLLRWRRAPGAAAGGGSLTIAVDGRPEPFHDGPARRCQLPTRTIRRLDLAGWAADADRLAASVRGRAFDAAAKARQEARSRAAALALAPASNRKARGGVALRTT